MNLELGGQRTMQTGAPAYLQPGRAALDIARGRRHAPCATARQTRGESAFHDEKYEKLPSFAADNVRCARARWLLREKRRPADGERRARGERYRGHAHRRW